MSETLVYPTLTEWVTDPIKKLDLILTDAAIANSDQSDIHNTVSFSAIYASTNTKKDFVDRLSKELEEYLDDHYETAEVKAISQDDGDTDLQISVVQDGHTFSGNYILKNKESLFSILNRESQ